MSRAKRAALEALIAEALATCPPGDWVEVDTLFTTMRRGHLSPTIARNDRALWKLYLVDPQYGRPRL